MYLPRSTQLVEAMKIPFRISNLHNTGPFQKIGPNSCSRYPTTCIKLYLHEFSKSAATKKAFRVIMQKEKVVKKVRFYKLKKKYLDEEDTRKSHNTDQH